MPNKIYADARRITHNRWQIGCCDVTMQHSAHKQIKAEDNNIAELEAIKFAKEQFPDCIVLSDSLNNVTGLNDPTVVYIDRELNIADSFLRCVKVR